MILAYNLKMILAEKGIFKYEAAEMCEIDPQRFYRLLLGITDFKEDDISKICKGLYISPNKLFGFVE